MLGLIYLRFADSKYGKYEEEINKEYYELKGNRWKKIEGIYDNICRVRKERGIGLTVCTAIAT
ncbi:MAG TPA: hypothetical protein PK733_00485 [Clostridiales bacterium]|nr:hypothetical protein [Clostridiales bacterium]